MRKPSMNSLERMRWANELEHAKVGIIGISNNFQIP